MENASKALLMAAGVLIGILILSLAVYLFVTFGGRSAELHQQIEVDRLNQFNSQFTSYEGKDDVTIYDVITVANLAKSNNEYYELESQTNDNYYITVQVKNDNGQKFNLEKYTQAQLQDTLIKTEQLKPDGTLPTYECKVTINPITEMVNKVTFEQKE